MCDPRSHGSAVDTGRVIIAKRAGLVLKIVIAYWALPIVQNA